MTKFSSHDKNWREDYKQFTNDPRDLKRLEEGAVSLASSWHLQAMYAKWKKIRGIDK